MARAKQLSLQFSTRGGVRPGAGRKPAPANVGLQPHEPRKAFKKAVPVHATMRAMRGTPAMRGEVVVRVVLAEIARASAKGFRVLHYSVQNDHLHVIAEGDDGVSFSRGMQRLASRIAMGINALVTRRGQFWRERYFRTDLKTPRQFRNALVYVTFNFRKHSRGMEKRLDLYSSALWFDGWSVRSKPIEEYGARAGPSPVVGPKSWVARVGWRKHGRIHPLEAPRTTRRSRDRSR